MTIAIAFTGHRPQDLPSHVNYQSFCAALDKLGVGARTDIQFVTGGAVGVDTWAAEYAISRSIPLHLVLPFRAEVQSKRWPEHAKKQLAAHMEHATLVTVLSQGPYDVELLQRRNEAMVDLADHVFAVWSGKGSGGTANCLRYAVGRKPVYNLWPLDGKLRPVTKAPVNIRFTRHAVVTE